MDLDIRILYYGSQIVQGFFTTDLEIRILYYGSLLMDLYLMILYDGFVYN